MKKIIIISIAVLLAACNSLEHKKAKLKEHKEEVKVLTEKIEKLEKEIADSTDETKYLIPVRIKQMEQEKFNHFIVVNGNVEALQQAHISPEIGGQLKQIHVVEGQRVKKGTLLISLNTSVTENGIQEVKSGLELATKIFAKQESLWEQNIGSEIQYLEAKNTKESLESKLKSLQAQKNMALIRAPFNGIVDEIHQKVGELAVPGFPIVSFVNLNNLKVKAKVSEAYLPLLKKNDIVEVSFSTYPDLLFNVPISRTGNFVDPGNRTFILEVLLKNQGEKIKPNMVASLKINDFSVEKALIVPSIIIKKDITGSFIFITEQKDISLIAKKVYLKPGKSYKDQTLILEGVKEGQQVIVEGYNTVSSGTEIEIL